MDTILTMDPTQRTMDSTQRDAGNEVCIYRVPQCLREGGREQNDYIPQVVSIGPYHHKQQQSREMEGLKVQILHQMLIRKEQNEETYLDEITALEPRARGCYDTRIDISSPEFVEMMLLDSCFVIEFLRSFTRNGYSPSYPIFAKRHIKYSISRDLIMLENQIPLFILNRIWELQQNQGEESEVREQQPNEGEELEFWELQSEEGEELEVWEQQPNEGEGLMVHFQYFIEDVGMPSNGRQYQQRQLEWKLQQNYMEALHCLDLFRRCFLEETMLRPQRRSRSFAGLDVDSTHLSIPSVTKLKEVGMEFEKREDLFWKIDYENGVLTLPILRIDDITKYLFVNLIAFEQCYLMEKDHITSYLIFLDNLINTSQDVSHLTKGEIIENLLGSEDEVATLFNTMGQGMKLSNYNNALQSKCNAINKYYRNNWNTWCAKLKRDYFNSPWSIISLIAGSLLIVLTALQTAYTIGAYYQSKN